MEASPEQIAAWKQQYGELHAVTVTIAEDATATVYLKPADRNVVAYALSLSARKQVMEVGEFILTNNFIGGDERLRLPTGKAETRAQIAAAIECSTILDVLGAYSKKL